MPHIENSMNFWSVVQHGLEAEVKSRIKTEIIDSAVESLKTDLNVRLDKYLNSIIFERIDSFERADIMRNEIVAYVKIIDEDKK